jgi:hypothetical protein
MQQANVSISESASTRGRKIKCGNTALFAAEGATREPEAIQNKNKTKTGNTLNSSRSQS